MHPWRPQPQRSPPMRTTTWPISPAALAAGPGPAVEHDPAADAGAPEHAEQRPVRPAGAERELGVGRDLDVVAEAQARAERLLERRAEGELALPVGQVARARDGARRGSTSPGEPTPTPDSASVSTPASPAASVSAAAIAAATSWPGRRSTGVGWRAWPSTVLAASTTTAWIFVPPRSMPPRVAPFGVLMAVML